MRLFFKDNIKSKKAFIFVYAVYYIVTTVVYTFFPSVALNTISSIIVIFIVTLCYNAKLSKKVIATVLAFSTLDVCEMIVAVAIGLSNVDIFESTYYGNSFCLIAVALLEFVVIKAIGKFKNLNNDAPVPKAFFAIAILISFISLLFETLLIAQENISDMIYALSLICVVSLNFLVIYLYDSISKLFDEKIKIKIAEQETEYYYKQAELIKKNSQEVKQLRHDMKNYTIALSELIKNNENEKASEYIKSISGALEPAKIYCETGILSVDSIVNYKFTSAEEAGIAVNSEIAIPYDLDLPSNDLVAILGNLLDNAIEASSKAENKYINFRIEYDKGTIIIVLKNSFDGKLNVEGNTYKTTKQDDSAMHGIGLRSIKSVIDKYNGEMKISHSDNEFSVKILLLV